jgi:Uma2 family endonuclease
MSQMTVSAPRPELFLLTEEGKGFELVNGELEEKPVSLLSSHVATKVNSRVELFAEQSKLGIVMQSDCTYQCFPHEPGRIRRPDGSFIRQERITPELLSEGHVTEAPDWVQETVSAHETAYETESKVDDYLRAGVKLIWVIHPEVRTVHVYRADGSVSRLRAGDVLNGEAVFPGFTCPVAELFPPVAAAKP